MSYNENNDYAFSVIKISWIASQERDDYQIAGYASTREKARDLASSAEGQTGDIILACPTEAISKIESYYTDVFIVNSFGVTTEIPPATQLWGDYEYEDMTTGWFHVASIETDPTRKIMFAYSHGLPRNDTVKIVLECVKSHNYGDRTGILRWAMSIAEQNMAGTECVDIELIPAEIEAAFNDPDNIGDTYLEQELQVARHLYNVFYRGGSVDILTSDITTYLHNTPPEVYEIVYRELPLRRILLLIADFIS